MKHCLLLVVAIAIFANRSAAQITLDQTFYGQTSFVLLSAGGEKILRWDTSTAYLYNMDYTIWKTMPVTTAYPGYSLGEILVTSDNFFNSDATVEFVAVMGAKNSTTHPTYRCVVMNEFGTVLQDFDSALYAYPHYNMVSSSYKLFTETYVAGSMPYRYNIYSVPGTLPCGECGSLGIEKPLKDNTPIGVSEPTPNPNDGTFTIHYQLGSETSTGIVRIFTVSGKLVKTIAVSQVSGVLQIETANLPDGTYIYTLTSENMASESRKMVVAH